MTRFYVFEYTYDYGSSDPYSCIGYVTSEANAKAFFDTRDGYQIRMTADYKDYRCLDKKAEAYRITEKIKEAFDLIYPDGDYDDAAKFLSIYVPAFHELVGGSN